jgi:hypothetical protein
VLLACGWRLKRESRVQLVLLLRFVKSRSSRSQIPLFPLPGLCMAEQGGGGVIRGGVGFEGPGARCATGAGVVGHVGCKAGGGFAAGLWLGCWLCAVAGGVSVAGCTRSQCGPGVGVRLSGVAMRSCRCLGRVSCGAAAATAAVAIGARAPGVCFTGAVAGPPRGHMTG